MNRKTPEHYVKRRKELNDRYYLLLHEVTTLFPKFKSRPDFPEYSKQFATDEGNMNKLQSDFFLMRNGLEKNISSLGKEIKQVDSKISIIEKENQDMSRKVQTLRMAVRQQKECSTIRNTCTTNRFLATYCLGEL